MRFGSQQVLKDFLFESDLEVANTLWTVGKEDLGGGFKHVLFSLLFEEGSHFD